MLKYRMSEANGEVSKRPAFLDSPQETLTLKDFRKALSYYASMHNMILSAQKKEMSSEERARLRQFNAVFCQELQKLANYVPLIQKPKRKRTVKNARAGFLEPKYFAPEIVEFFKEVDLGKKCVVKDGKIVATKEDLKKSLGLFLKHGVTSSSLLTPLFSIYIKLNSDELVCKDNGQCIKFNAAMRKYFEGVCKKIEKDVEEQRKEIAEQVKRGQLPESALQKIPPFDLNKFRRPRLQTLIKYMTVPKESLSEEKLNFLKSPETYKSLKAEQEVVSLANQYYNQEE